MSSSGSGARSTADWSRTGETYGDITGGFDPADATLAALPDSRTFDPFGEPLADNGVKYQIGHQGDWTDPATGDTNQGARWYNPGSGTFNSRDTVGYASGTPSNFPNLYAYAGGSPVRYDDPTGNGVPSECRPGIPCECWVEYIYAGPEKLPIPKTVCPKGQGEDDDGDGNGPPGETCEQRGDCPKTCEELGSCPKKTCKQTNTCPIKNCKQTNSCPKKTCKQTNTCKPPKPKCDPQCQKEKKEEEDRRRTENAQKNIEKILQKKEIHVPGAPGCSGGNPRLCATPDKPSPGGTGRNINPNIGGVVDDIFQDLVDKTGPVVGSISGPSGGSIFDHMGMGMGSLPTDVKPVVGTRGGGFPTGTQINVGAALGGLGIALSELAKNLTIAGPTLDALKELGGGQAAQPPDPDDDEPKGAQVGEATRKDYRETFFQANPHLNRVDYVVHHAVEQGVLKRYPGLFKESELHSVQNLRGIPRNINGNLHLSKIRKDWDRWYDGNPNPSRQDVLDHATEIDKRYGDQFVPKVGYK